VPASISRIAAEPTSIDVYAIRRSKRNPEYTRRKLSGTYTQYKTVPSSWLSFDSGMSRTLKTSAKGFDYLCTSGKRFERTDLDDLEYFLKMRMSVSKWFVGQYLAPWSI
jgi:hypothetical protein